MTKSLLERIEALESDGTTKDKKRNPVNQDDLYDLLEKISKLENENKRLKELIIAISEETIGNLETNYLKIKYLEK